MDADARGMLKERTISFKKARVACTNPRLRTRYAAWPHRTPTAAVMAAAGFVYRPTAQQDDNVECCNCKVQIFGWDRVRDPTAKHTCLPRPGHRPVNGNPPITKENSGGDISESGDGSMNSKLIPGYRIIAFDRDTASVASSPTESQGIMNSLLIEQEADGVSSKLEGLSLIELEEGITSGQWNKLRNSQIIDTTTQLSADCHSETIADWPTEAQAVATPVPTTKSKGQEFGSMKSDSRNLLLDHLVNADVIDEDHGDFSIDKINPLARLAIYRTEESLQKLQKSTELAFDMLELHVNTMSTHTFTQALERILYQHQNWLESIGDIVMKEVIGSLERCT